MRKLGHQDYLYIQSTMHVGAGEQWARFNNEMDDAMRTVFVQNYLSQWAEEWSPEELVAMLIDSIPEAEDYILDEEKEEQNV